MVAPQLQPLLVRNMQKSPLMTSNLLDSIQSRYNCCGIGSKDDYNHLSLTPLPSSCCRVDNCWSDTDTNKNNSSIPSMHEKGCYPIIDQYVTLQLWTFIGITALCALLQFLAITLMCVLNQRYKKFNENDPKFTVTQLASGVPINSKMENEIPGSTTTIEETVEITQI